MLRPPFHLPPSIHLYQSVLSHPGQSGTVRGPAAVLNLRSRLSPEISGRWNPTRLAHSPSLIACASMRVERPRSRREHHTSCAGTLTPPHGHTHLHIRTLHTPLMPDFPARYERALHCSPSGTRPIDEASETGNDPRGRTSDCVHIYTYMGVEAPGEIVMFRADHTTV